MTKWLGAQAGPPNWRADAQAWYGALEHAIDPHGKHPRQTRERALALDGWVRNCPDGSVELLAIGDEVALERMAEACRGGPPAASVADVQALAADDDGSVGFAARS